MFCAHAPSTTIKVMENLCITVSFISHGMDCRFIDGENIPFDIPGMLHDGCGSFHKVTLYRG
jgi:hypothetical protein